MKAVEKKLRSFMKFPNYPVIEIRPENKQGEYVHLAVNNLSFEYCKYLGKGYSEQGSIDFKTLTRLFSMKPEQIPSTIRRPRGLGELQKQLKVLQKEYPEIWSKLQGELK